MKAPAPVFTSNTKPSSPSASFLLMMLAQISGIGFHCRGDISKGVQLSIGGCNFVGLPNHGAAYLFDHGPEPGKRELNLKTGNRLELSSVPPVKPRPRPEIIGT